MKTFEGVEVYIHLLTSALDGGEWLASRHGLIIPGTLSIGGCKGPRAGQDVVQKR